MAKNTTFRLSADLLKLADRRRKDVAAMLEAFLDYVIDLNDATYFADGTWEDHARQMWATDPELMQLYLGYCDNVATAMEQGRACDPLGEAYEELTSGHKHSRLGQFFTPIDVCTLMAEVNIPDHDTPGATISDSACGSGRTLLAVEMVRDRSERAYYHADDRDPICAKMCAVNLMTYGMHGMVVERDTLMHDFRRAYYINEVRYPIRSVPYVSIRKIDSRELCDRIEHQMIAAHKNCIMRRKKTPSNSPEGGGLR